MILQNKQGSGFRGQGSGVRKNCTRHFSPCTLKRSFTLMELLITTAILGLVGLAIASTLASGLNVYKHLRSYSGIETDVLLALERIDRDLRTAFVFSKIEFRGREELVSFPAMVRGSDAEGEESLVPGRMSYYFDSIKGILSREEQDYSLAILGKFKTSGKRQELASLDKLEFSYYYYDQASEEYGWSSSWERQELEDEAGKSKKVENRRLWVEDGKVLLGVKIRVAFKEKLRKVSLVRTVLFPVAVSYRWAQLIEEGLKEG